MLRTFFKTILIFGLIFTISCEEDPISPAITGDISGTVSDDETGAAIGNASVTTSPPSSAIKTDADGTFKFTGLDAGSYTISVSKTGYKTANVTVAVKETKETRAEISLKMEATTTPAIPTAKSPSPEAGALNQATTITLEWSVDEFASRVDLSFDLSIYDETTTVMKFTGLTDTAYVLENLKFNTTYLWQVSVSDTADQKSNSELWSFSTRQFPSQPLIYASNETGNFEIYSASSTDTLDTELLQLTSSASNNLWPRFNSQGSKIAFISDRNSDHHIFTMNLDGSSISQITSLPVAGYHNNGKGFCWSPDGSKLLYGHYNKLYQIDSRGGSQTLILELSTVRHFKEIEWSGTLDKIIFSTVGVNPYDNEINMMNADGSNIQLLVKNQPGIIGSPTFSPDGQEFIYTHDISGTELESGRMFDSRIFIQSTTSTDSTDISQGKPDGTNDLYPRFSPDGAKIVFTNSPNNNSNSGSLWVMDKDGANRKKIVSAGMMADWH